MCMCMRGQTRQLHPKPLPATPQAVAGYSLSRCRLYPKALPATPQAVAGYIPSRCRLHPKRMQIAR